MRSCDAHDTFSFVPYSLAEQLRISEHVQVRAQMNSDFINQIFCDHNDQIFDYFFVQVVIMLTIVHYCRAHDKG